MGDHAPQGRERLRWSPADLLLHVHPKSVPAEALRFEHTLGLGGVAIVLVLVAAATGALLLPAYDPAPERAHDAVWSISHEQPFGDFVRGLHWWASNLALLASALHLLRVFFRGAHRPPRHVNWLVGLALLGVLVASAYTGRLLPWDQLAYWSVTATTAALAYVPFVGEPLLRLARNGSEVGPGTLTLFHGLHVALLPPMLFVLVAFHAWLVRRAGGILLPAGSGRDGYAPVSPRLLLREGTAALVALAVVSLLAAVVSAPLLAQAEPRLSPNPALAPWYLAGLQELLVHLPPLVAAVLAPIAGIAILAALPALGGGEVAPGTWFGSGRGRKLALAAGAAGAVVTLILILGDEAARGALAARLPFVRTARVGLLVGLPVVALGWIAVRVARAHGTARAELVQATFAWVLASLAVLTVIGALFRGPGMALVGPWSGGAP